MMNVVGLFCDVFSLFSRRDRRRRARGDFMGSPPPFSPQNNRRRSRCDDVEKFFSLFRLTELQLDPS